MACRYCSPSYRNLRWVSVYTWDDTSDHSDPEWSADHGCPDLPIPDFSAKIAALISGVALTRLIARTGWTRELSASAKRPFWFWLEFLILTFVSSSISLPKWQRPISDRIQYLVRTTELYTLYATVRSSAEWHCTTYSVYQRGLVLLYIRMDESRTNPQDQQTAYWRMNESWTNRRDPQMVHLPTVMHNSWSTRVGARKPGGEKKTISKRPCGSAARCRVHPGTASLV